MSRSDAAFRGWERRRENEECVTINIPADLLPLWHRTKRGFRGTPHERFEQFIEYAEAHALEVVAALQDEADRTLDDEIAAFQARAQ